MRRLGGQWPAALVSDESALEACIRDDALYKLTIFFFEETSRGAGLWFPTLSLAYCTIYTNTKMENVRKGDSLKSFTSLKSSLFYKSTPCTWFWRAKAATALARLSHRNSVCLSVRLLHRWISQQIFTVGCPKDSSFRIRKAIPYIQKGSIRVGMLNERSEEKWRFSAYKSPYLRNGAR